MLTIALSDAALETEGVAPNALRAYYVAGSLLYSLHTLCHLMMTRVI